MWDALAAEVALDCCRGMPPDAAAEQIVKVPWQLDVSVSGIMYASIRWIDYCIFSLTNCHAGTVVQACHLVVCRI